MEDFFLSIWHRIFVMAVWTGICILFYLVVVFLISIKDEVRTGHIGKLLIQAVAYGLIAYGIYWGLDLDRLFFSPASTGPSGPSLSYTQVSQKPARYYDENSEEEEKERSDEEIFEEEDDYPPDIPGVYESYGRTVRVVEVRHSRWTEPDYRVEEIDDDYDTHEHIRR